MVKTKINYPSSDFTPFGKAVHRYKQCVQINQNLGVSAGLQLSRLSLGGGPFGGLYGEASEQACIDTVHLALKSGINYIDTAPWYGSGRSEEVLGKVSQDMPLE